MLLKLVPVGAVTAAWFAATDETNFQPDAVQAAVVVSYLVGLAALVRIGGWVSLPVFALLFLGAQLIRRGENGVANFVIEAPIVLMGMAAAAAGQTAWRSLKQPRPPLWVAADTTESLFLACVGSRTPLRAKPDFVERADATPQP